MSPTLQNILAKAESWPTELQAELAEIVHEMDTAFRGGIYHATDEELAAIDQAIASTDAGHFATDEEVAAVFAKYAPAKQRQAE